MANILVVDDTPLAQEATRTALQKGGYHVQTACDGEEALGLIAGYSFDCVVTDGAMPNVSGAVLLQRIRACGYDMPVILTSTFPDDWTTALPADLHFSAVLTRPFENALLLNAVKQALETQGDV